MGYREEQRERAVAIRDRLFRDPGAGVFFNKERDFVLSDATLNLWDGIREDAIAYFSRNQIAWWRGSEEQTPTGHLLSSQVACVNHLYFARQRADVATGILKSVDDSIDSAVVVDDGFVEFEVIGAEDYLNERNRTRGGSTRMP